METSSTETPVDVDVLRGEIQEVHPGSTDQARNFIFRSRRRWPVPRSRHRRRHDAGDAAARARERNCDGPGHSRAARVADRDAAAPGRIRRRGHLERRHRPRARQGGRVLRDRPRPAPGRAAAARRRGRPHGGLRGRAQAHRVSGPAESPGLSWKESTRASSSGWATSRSRRATSSTPTRARRSRTPAARPRSSARWGRPSVPPSPDAPGAREPADGRAAQYPGWDSNPHGPKATAF
jgi:hypothetical protein